MFFELKRKNQPVWCEEEKEKEKLCPTRLSWCFRIKRERERER